MKRRLSLLCVVLLTIAFLIPQVTRRVRAQDAAPAPVPTPNDVIDQIMGQIGQGRIDDAVGMMDGLKNQADLKSAARSRLITLRDDQGQYHGYDIAAVQRFTPQLQTDDVLAYYDDQPVLIRFHFYRPILTGGKWAILGFQVSTSIEEMKDILKDTPVDYVGRRKAE
jgi:hypothetical protein